MLARSGFRGPATAVAPLAAAAWIFVQSVAGCATPRPGAQQPVVEARMVLDEADAALAILRHRAAGQPVSDSAWQALFATEGYRRLQRRERAMRRPFEDSSFRAFIMSDTLLARTPALERTLAAWRRLDPTTSARRALAYLPPNTAIRAKIYPVIKPKTNSFVFETRTDPAIFMYLDPGVSAPKLDNTLTHELHHIGVGSVCSSVAADTTVAAPLRDALAWMSGFSEGRAVLAAAGDPVTHPHALSDSAERAIWDRDVGKVGGDVRRLQAFFTDILDGRLTEEEMNRRGFEFVATDSVPQGAFYTVGWLMAATIEKAFGRERVVSSICDPLAFLTDYNRTAEAWNRGPAVRLPMWSREFLDRLRAR